MPDWSFLEPCPAPRLHRPRPWMRLRDIATTPGITMRSTLGIVTGLIAAGHVTKGTHGRRNRSSRQVRLPLHWALIRRSAPGAPAALAG
jgi:hypothetical protein